MLASSAYGQQGQGEIFEILLLQGPCYARSSQALLAYLLATSAFALATVVVDKENAPAFPAINSRRCRAKFRGGFTF